LYPNYIFSSVGGIVKEAECSICKQDVRSAKCTHITGCLYNGELAQVIYIKFDLHEVSIVTNPYDKRCVMIPEGGYGEVWKLGLKEFGKFQRLATLDFNVKEYIKDYEKTDESHQYLCFCNSGLKFKDCCWTTSKDNFLHKQIVIKEYFSLKPNFNTA
jgi:hypothetical protein